MPVYLALVELLRKGPNLGEGPFFQGVHHRFLKKFKGALRFVVSRRDARISCAKHPKSLFACQNMLVTKRGLKRPSFEHERDPREASKDRHFEKADSLGGAKETEDNPTKKRSPFYVV